MLHRDRIRNDTSSPANEPNHSSNPTDSSPVVQSITSALMRNNSTVTSSLLMTAQIILRSEKGNKVKVRALLDTGSSASLLTYRAANQLKLKKSKRSTLITGIQGHASNPSEHVCSFIAEIPGQNKEILATTAIVDRITHNLPSQRIHGAEDWTVTKNLKLADPLFYIPSAIDMLVGMDILPQILLSGNHTAQDSEPTAFNTVFGWALAGPYKSRNIDSFPVSLHVTCQEAEPVDLLLQKFWEAEDELHQTNSFLTAEEQRAMDIFEDTISRTVDGRYQVSLPRKETEADLGESKDMALRRLYSTERTLTRKGRWSEFRDAMNDYLDQDHAEPVPTGDGGNTHNVFYMPMHIVSKPSSTSTKTRVVFDASAQTSNGRSLNDILLPGPKVYPEITDLLMTFRVPAIAFTADITKMFRQISLTENDRDLHHFLYRSSPKEHITEYRMKRLTFGVTSSPFIATQTLRQVANDFGNEFPDAAEMVKSKLYVDDLLAGADDVSKAIDIRQQMNDLLRQGGFLLKKWRSNSPDLLKTIPDHLKETEPIKTFPHPTDSLKTLGVHWDTIQDRLHISTPTISTDTTNLDQVQLTKRKLISDISKVYDVLGWFTPCVFLAKCLMQDVWRSKVGWDEEVPNSIKLKWMAWATELPKLTSKPIQRRYTMQGKAPISTQLHGFSDASLKGYAAAVYIRTVYEDTTVTITLVAAKSKVAPLKAETIPRLELSGTVLLAKLLNHICDVLNIPLSNVHAWCDSQVVLAWLNSSKSDLPVYVRNRTRQVNSLLPSTIWHYVKSEENPADCASRGMLASKLLSHTLWWEGPNWLKNEPALWPMSLQAKGTTEPEIMVNYVQTTQEDFTRKYSSLNRLKRIIAWILRFFHNVRWKNTKKSLYYSIS